MTIMLYEGFFSVLLVLGYVNIIGDYLLPVFNASILTIYSFKYFNRFTFFFKRFGLFDIFCLSSVVLIALLNYTSASDLLKLIAYFIFFYICVIASSPDKLKSWEFAAVCTAILTILVSLPLYIVYPESVYRFDRLTSIFLDPNYYGLFLGYGILCLINGRFKFKYILIPLVFFGLFLTYSKTAFVSLFVALCSAVRVQYIIFIFIASSIVLCLYYSDPTLFDFLNGFRFESGFNKRDIFWDEAIGKLLHAPFRAYGHEEVLKLLEGLGFDEVSLHNTYLEYAFNYSLASLAIYCIFLLRYLKISGVRIRNLSFLLYFGTASLLMSLTIGGVGYFPVLFASYLGCYYFHEKN